MISLMNHMGTMKRLVTTCAVPILIAASLFSAAAIAGHDQLSDKYSMDVDPAAKQQLGEQTYTEVMAFFHAAEQAIEAKDLAALMALYSDNYSAGDHDKKSAEQTWQRMFATFDSMAMLHRMKLEKASAARNVVVFKCTGLLVGVPGQRQGAISTDKPITIDNWTNQDHILVKEAGKWKLIGTYGLERKRLWFDKPMHPLF